MKTTQAEAISTCQVARQVKQMNVLDPIEWHAASGAGSSHQCKTFASQRQRKKISLTQNHTMFNRQRTAAVSCWIRQLFNTKVSSLSCRKQSVVFLRKGLLLKDSF